MGFKKTKVIKETEVKKVLMDIVKQRTKLDKSDCLVFAANDFYIGNYNGERYVMLINDTSYVFLPSIEVEDFIITADDIKDVMLNGSFVSFEYIAKKSKSTGRTYYICNY